MQTLTKEQFKEKVLADQKKRQQKEKQKKTMIDVYFMDACYRKAMMKKRGRV